MDNMEIEQKLIELEKRIKNIEFEQLDSAGEFQKLAQEVIQEEKAIANCWNPSTNQTIFL